MSIWKRFGTNKHRHSFSRQTIASFSNHLQKSTPKFSLSLQFNYILNGQISTDNQCSVCYFKVLCIIKCCVMLKRYRKFIIYSFPVLYNLIKTFSLSNGLCRNVTSLYRPFSKSSHSHIFSHSLHRTHFCHWILMKIGFFVHILFDGKRVCCR